MSKRQGFTLVELIVVLVILAVLAALAVPALTGYIDKANAAKCMANRRYAYVDLTADYLFDGETALPTNQNDLCRDPDYSQYQCPTRGKLSYKLDKKERQIEVFCSEHHKSGSFGDAQDMQTILEKMATVDTTQLDSGAIKRSASNLSGSQLLDTLSGQGLDLNEMGAVSWHYDKATNSLYWTDVDIDQLDEGVTTTPVIKYNGNNGLYTVWFAKIEEKTRMAGEEPYLILSDKNLVKYAPSHVQGADKTYESALKWLADAQEGK